MRQHAIWRCAHLQATPSDNPPVRPVFSPSCTSCPSSGSRAQPTGEAASAGAWGAPPVWRKVLRSFHVRPASSSGGRSRAPCVSSRVPPSPAEIPAPNSCLGQGSSQPGSGPVATVTCVTPQNHMRKCPPHSDTERLVLSRTLTQALSRHTQAKSLRPHRWATTPSATRLARAGSCTAARSWTPSNAAWPRVRSCHDRIESPAPVRPPTAVRRRSPSTVGHSRKSPVGQAQRRDPRRSSRLAWPRSP